MKIPLWVSQAAQDFWKEVGRLEPFPRLLQESILCSPFELTVKEFGGLTVRGTADYLARLNIVWTAVGPDRPLRACLAAASGAGFILLDAADLAEERTFSLAHELAHFLRHYWQPRQRARRCLGEQIVDVFDGKRPATPQERLHGLLAGAPLGLHVHLLLRGPRLTCSRHVALVEEEADRLAYELLAPAADVFQQLRGTRGKDRAGRAAQVLRSVFGLPVPQAEEYSRLLFPAPREDPLLRRLRRSE